MKDTQKKAVELLGAEIEQNVFDAVTRRLKSIRLSTATATIFLRRKNIRRALKEFSRR